MIRPAVRQPSAGIYLPCKHVGKGVPAFHPGLGHYKQRPYIHFIHKAQVNDAACVQYHDDPGIKTANPLQFLCFLTGKIVIPCPGFSVRSLAGNPADYIDCRICSLYFFNLPALWHHQRICRVSPVQRIGIPGNGNIVNMLLPFLSAQFILFAIILQPLPRRDFNSGIFKPFFNADRAAVIHHPGAGSADNRVSGSAAVQSRLLIFGKGQHAVVGKQNHPFRRCPANHLPVFLFPDTLLLR